jgi:hypothetical protein
MQIVIGFDEQLLTKWDRRRDVLLFRIAWRCDNIYYPQENWIDFGLVILGWWLGIADRLWQGIQEEDFFFMDGPYSIKAIQHQAEDVVELIPRGLDVTCRTSLAQLSDELIHAANEVCSVLAQTEGSEVHRVVLEKGIARLKATIQQSLSK